MVAAVAAVVVVVAVVFAVSDTTSATQPPGASASSLRQRLVAAGSAGPLGPEGIPVPDAPILVGTYRAAVGQPVDDIACATGEQLAFHVHTHLTIFVHGAARQVPAGVGITPPRQAQQTPRGVFVDGGGCFYWLHTHAADGIIHIESPLAHRAFTLGDFFDIWGVRLGPQQVGPATGPVTAFYNGKVYRGDPRSIPLGNHTQIQLDVGTPLVAPESVTFPSGL